MSSDVFRVPSVFQNSLAIYLKKVEIAREVRQVSPQ